LGAKNLEVTPGGGGGIICWPPPGDPTNSSKFELFATPLP